MEAGRETEGGGNVHALLEKDVNVLDAPFTVSRCDNAEFFPEVIAPELKAPGRYDPFTSTFSGVVDVRADLFREFLTLSHGVEQRSTSVNGVPKEMSEDEESSAVKPSRGKRWSSKVEEEHGEGEFPCYLHEAGVSHGPRIRKKISAKTYDSIPDPNQRKHPPSPLVRPSQDVTGIIRQGSDAVLGFQVRTAFRVGDVLQDFFEKIVQQDEAKGADIAKGDVACS